MTTFLAELDTSDSTPALAASLLRGPRIKAVEIRGDEPAQIGVAYDFHLQHVGEDQRIALVCRMELDDERHDAVKHRLTDGQEHLYAGNHRVLGAIGD